MRKLVLLTLLLVAIPGMAQAQWTFDRIFPSDESTDNVENHGLAVSPDGRVWTQAYYPFTGDSVFVEALGANQRVTALYCFNPDGTQCPFSPLTIVSFPGGVQDTLGGGAYRNSNGEFAWTYNSGRGLRTDHDGNILVAFHNGGTGQAMLYRINYQDGSGMNIVSLRDVAPALLTNGQTAPAVDEFGNIFITSVFPGGPIVVLNPDFTFRETAVDTTYGFSRSFEVSKDGNTIYYAGYSFDAVVRYSRPDEFSKFGQTPDTLLTGFSSESFAWDPKTGYLWMSAGSPNDPPDSTWQSNTWYAFDVDDFSVRQDSLTWNEEATAGRPRAIAFTATGDTVYVGQFSQTANAVQRFVRGEGSAVEPMGELPGGYALKPNYPNPFSGKTIIEFAVPQASRATLKVYDTLGREVATLVDGMLAPDTYRVDFDASKLSSGLYVYRLDAGGRQLTGTMTVLR